MAFPSVDPPFGYLHSEDPYLIRGAGVSTAFLVINDAHGHAHSSFSSFLNVLHHIDASGPVAWKCRNGDNLCHSSPEVKAIQTPS